MQDGERLEYRYPNLEPNPHCDAEPENLRLSNLTLSRTLTPTPPKPQTFNLILPLTVTLKHSNPKTPTSNHTRIQPLALNPKPNRKPQLHER